MECKPDITKIKCEENQKIVEDINDSSYTDFCLRVKVEVDNDIEFTSMHSLVAPTEKISYETNKNYQVHTYDLNEEYQEHVHYGILKEENSLTIQNDMNYYYPVQKELNKKHQDYEELIQETCQTCMLCGKYFRNSYSLLQHNLIHLRVPLIKRKLFMCEFCPQYYKKKCNLKNHIQRKHVNTMVTYNRKIPITKQNHKCLICDKTFAYKTWFSHMTDVHSGNQFKCKKCNSSFKCRRYLNRHNRSVHMHVEPGLHFKKAKIETKCTLCPAVVSSGSALTTHMRNCHSQNTYTCQICKSTLKCKSYLLTHMRRVHYNDGIVYDCKICGKEFKSQRYLKIHIKNMHMKSEIL